MTHSLKHTQYTHWLVDEVHAAQTPKSVQKTRRKLSHDLTSTQGHTNTDGLGPCHPQIRPVEIYNVRISYDVEQTEVWEDDGSQSKHREDWRKLIWKEMKLWESWAAGDLEIFYSAVNKDLNSASP